MPSNHPIICRPLLLLPPILPNIRVFSKDSTLCMKHSLGISNFLEKISSLSHFIVFLYFIVLISEEGFLISPCYSLELCIQMGISFLFSFAFHFSSFCRYLSGLLKHFTFSHFFFLGIVLITASCTMSQTSVHSSSGTLSDLIPWIYFSPHIYRCESCTIEKAECWRIDSFELWFGEDSWESLGLQGDPTSPS